MDIPILKDIKKNLTKERQRERSNFLQWQERQEQEKALDEASLPEPACKPLRMGEPVVLLNFIASGILTHMSLAYYRGKNKSGNDVFSTLPISPKYFELKPGTKWVRFAKFSPYNIRSNFNE